MIEPTHISDDPLPPADPAEPLAKPVAALLVVPQEDNKLHLEDPNLVPVSSYGRTDPASLTATQSHDLPDPSLEVATSAALANPSLTKFVPDGEGVLADRIPESAPHTASAAEDFSKWDPHLAHLAQVGLTSADHWDEQIKPRIDQLQEDITQVNQQLDDLEKAKPKPKKS